MSGTCLVSQGLINSFDNSPNLCRVTPEEIYQAEKSGRDLVWPGSETDIPEDEMPEEMPEEVEYTTNAHSNHHQHPSHHDSQSSLSNGTAQSNGYTAAAAAAHESSQYCASVSEEAASSSPSGSSSYQGGINQTGTTNRSSASHLNNSNNSNSSSNNNNRDGYSNGGGGNKSGSKTNMAKSNSLSDYNLYHNGKTTTNSLTVFKASFQSSLQGTTDQILRHRCRRQTTTSHRSTATTMDTAMDRRSHSVRPRTIRMAQLATFKVAPQVSLGYCPKVARIG